MRCVECQRRSVGDREWFKLFGLSYGEKQGRPNYLIKKLPATFCSGECLLQHVETVICDSVDRFFDMRSK